MTPCFPHLAGTDAGQRQPEWRAHEKPGRPRAERWAESHQSAVLSPFIRLELYLVPVFSKSPRDPDGQFGAGINELDTGVCDGTLQTNTKTLSL